MEKKIYNKLEELGIIEIMKETDWIKVENKPFMPLSIEKLYSEKDKLIISLSHYFVQNGDLVPDPDMEVEIDLKNKTARALTFQNQILYQRVEDRNSKLQDELNIFLSYWLDNIKNQGCNIKKVYG